MFARLWSSSATPAVAKNEAEEPPESDSASPPPPSESVPPTVTPAPKPKPRKPRTSKKKAPAEAEDAPDASQNGNADLRIVITGTNGPDGSFTDLDGLRQLVADVPARTLHQFVKQRLDVQRAGVAKKRPNANVFPTLENDYPVISAFFTGLVAPPKHHCLRSVGCVVLLQIPSDDVWFRCHQDYYDVDNSPRSCVSGTPALRTLS